MARFESMNIKTTDLEGRKHPLKTGIMLVLETISGSLALANSKINQVPTPANSFEDVTLLVAELRAVLQVASDDAEALLKALQLVKHNIA